MGKKASLTLDLNYDYEDLEENYYEDYYNDEPQGRPTPKPNQTAPKKPNHFRTSIHGTYQSQPSNVSVKLYQRRPAGMASPFCSLLLNGHDMLVVQIAWFLELRSIAALSCTNKTLDKILAQECLYVHVHGSDSLILPCLRGIMLPKLECPRFIRGLAMESSLFSRQKGPRNRNLTLVKTIQSAPGSIFLHSAISKSCSSVTTVSDQGQVLDTKIIPNATNRVNRVGHEKCSNVLASVLSPKFCATITMPLSGNRRYVVSLIPTRAFSGSNCKIIWQQDILLSPSLRSRPPSIQFDNTCKYVVVVLSSRMCVFSSDQGKLLWDLTLEKHQQPWHAWAVRDKYISAYAKKSILIFDILQQRLVASGLIPVCQKGITKIHGNQPPQLHIFQDCVWIACYPILFRTGCILKRLSRCVTTPSQPQSTLSIKKFHIVTDLASMNPLLRCCGDRLYVADGNLIRIYGSKNMQDDAIEPCQVICAEGTIENIQVDSTKVVCCVNDGKKRQIELLRLDIMGNSSLFESVFVKNAATFADRYYVDNLDFRGNLLMVSYTSSATQKSELRIFRRLE